MPAITPLTDVDIDDSWKDLVQLGLGGLGALGLPDEVDGPWTPGDGDGVALPFGLTKTGFHANNLYVGASQNGPLSAVNGKIAAVTVSVPPNIDSGVAVTLVQQGFYSPVTPTISKVSRTGGKVSANILVLIRGKGLLTATSVTFGGIECEGFKALSDNELFCKPCKVNAAGSANIVITTAKATGSSASAPTSAPATYAFTKATSIADVQTVLLNGGSPAVQAAAFIVAGLASDSWFIDGNSSGLGIVWNLNGSTGVQIAGTAPPNGFTTISHPLAFIIVAYDGYVHTFDHHGLWFRLQLTGSVGNKELLVTPYAMIETTSVDQDAQSMVNGYTGDCYGIGGNQTTDPVPIGMIWRKKINSEQRPSLIEIPGYTFGFSMSIPGKVMLTYDVLNFKLCSLDVDCNLTELGIIPGIVFLTGGDYDGQGNWWFVGIDGSNGYHIIKITGGNVTGATIIPMPSPAMAGNAILFGPDGFMYVNGPVFSTTVDSVVFKYDLNMNLAHTFTLANTHSTVAPSPAFCYGLAATDDGNVLVTIQAIQGASRSGCVVKLGNNT